MENPNCYMDDMKYDQSPIYIYIARAETFGGAKKMGIPKTHVASQPISDFHMGIQWMATNRCSND